MSAFPSLLSPLSIKTPNGALTVRNRVMVSAHVPGFAENNKPGQQYIDYHRQYAAGGVGLQFTGGTPVHESGLLGTSADALWNLDDSIIPGYQALANAVHDEGGHIIAQLAHSGGTVPIDQPGRASWAPSALRSAATGRVSHEMSLAQIAEVESAYASAASRVCESGLDGVELLAAFGFLPQAFLSPLTNKRQDDYGGSLENRMRFLVNVLGAVREKMGPDQVLGVRLPGDEFEPGGLELSQMSDICTRLSESGLVDYLNIIAHTNFSHTGRSKHWAPTPTPQGVFVDLAATIREHVNVPVFAVGRIVDPAHAESIIAEGKADMVGMTRAHICDPRIVLKIQGHEPESIRPCVGANTCIANRYLGKTIRCMHNPMLASPGQPLLPITRKKSLTVIGAGPAGLEVARLCALRGHRVIVHEATDHPGGQLAVWASSPTMRELGRIIQWRKSELERLGVVVHYNSPVGSSELATLESDEVIVATGATERVRNFDLSSDKPSDIPVVSPTELLKLEMLDATAALVCNDGRGQAGLVAAEWLLSRGIQVEIITADFAVAADIDPTNRNAWYERLGKSGVVMTAQSEIESLSGDECLLRNIWSDRVTKRTGVDVIVDWNGCVPVDNLLSDGQNSTSRIEWHAIGDCIAPRNVEVAMAEALALANRT